MTGRNGTNGVGRKLTPLDPNKDPTNRDQKTGRLLPGHQLSSPGKPKSTLNFMEICKRKAKAIGVDLDSVVWSIMKGLLNRAKDGDAAASKILLDRLCGVVEKGFELHVDVDNRSVTIGPPVPEGRELGEYIRGMNEVAAEQGWLGDETPKQVEAKAMDDAAVRAAEIEELLG